MRCVALALNTETQRGYLSMVLALTLALIGANKRLKTQMLMALRQPAAVWRGGGTSYI